MFKKCSSAFEALECVQSGHHVFIHGCSATPIQLIQGLIDSSSRLQNVELVHIHTFGDAPYAHPKYKGVFKVRNLFVGSNVRKYLDYDRVDYLPCFLSEIPQLFRSGRCPIDIALIHVSPPDAYGICTLGTSVDITLTAIEMAKIVVAQVNPNMPRVHGDGFIHKNKIDYYIDVNDGLPVLPLGKIGEAERAIGRFTSGLIEDGSTLQVGIGAIPDAVLAELKDHRHLGVHTEMWSDGMVDLILSGVVDNSKKAVHPGKTVSSFIMGTQRVYDFAHDNPSIIQLDISYVNDTRVIRRNPQVVAINSALEVDLTGQVCADSIGTDIYSGVGGQMDFIRGASLSKDGKPIIALKSRTSKGESRIVSMLKQGAGVVTTRAHVHYIVTEYGVADLYGKTLNERAHALISIAHPEDREMLDGEWFKRKNKK